MNHAEAIDYTDLKSVKEFVLRQQNTIEKLEKQSKFDRTKILFLEEQILLLRRARFARLSEKLKEANKNQLSFFDEAEVLVSESEPDSDSEADNETEVVKSHQRGKPKRQKFADWIERVDRVIDLLEEEKTCPEGHELSEISEEVSEHLDIIPMQVKVIRTIRKKYACKKCESHVKIAPVPPRILPKSNASEGLLAYIATSKYADGLPLYRQSKMFERLEIDLPRTTMASWMVRLGREVEPILNLMREDVKSSSYIQCDETPLQVLDEPGKKATSKSYMWVYGRASPEEKPIVLYEYDPTRKGEVPQRLFEDFEGYLQVDGYDGYNPVAQKKSITRVGCFAHCRRKFFEAMKASKKKGQANKGLKYIQKLYKIEKDIITKGPEEKHQIREEQAGPILKEMKAWLDEMLPQTLPKSALGKAILYALNEWTYLTRYIQDGNLRIDNNWIENKIRPFSLGRKAWLFANTPQGAQASANLYSLIETAKANQLNPYDYLVKLFTELPTADSLQKLESLLPYNKPM